MTTPYLREAYESQPISISRTEVDWPVTFNVYNVPNEYEALKFAFFTAPQFKGGNIPLDTMTVGSRLGLTTWAIDAKYNSKRAEPLNKDAVEGSAVPGLEAEEVDYDLSGENRNIKQSLETWSYANPLGDPAPDEGGAIGRDQKSVKGVDIPFPVVTFGVRRQWQRQHITLTMRGVWERMYGKVNNATFRGYARGEVRFDGAQCSLKGSPTQLIPVTFKFAARFNAASVPFLEAGFTVANLEGWHVLDQRFTEKEDTGASAMVRRLTHAYKHRVLEYADFSTLGV